MSYSLRSAERLVDRFVDVVNGGTRELEPLEEIPVPCRCALPDEFDDADWQIARSTEASWFDDTERQAGVRFPPAFRVLVTKYLFPRFDIGPVRLFAVGLAEVSPAFEHVEFRAKVFCDSGLVDFLLPLGLIPFAQPPDINYDPICFDFRARQHGNDPPIVRVDHERILCYDKLRIVEIIEPSFSALLTRRIEGVA